MFSAVSVSQQVSHSVSLSVHRMVPYRAPHHTVFFKNAIAFQNYVQKLKTSAELIAFNITISIHMLKNTFMKIMTLTYLFISFLRGSRMSFPRNGKLPTRGRFGGPGGKRACLFLLLNNKEINIKILQGGAITISEPTTSRRYTK